MKARIFKPTRNAMQSGDKKVQGWRFEFIPETSLYTDPLMGWTGMTDMTREVKLTFETLDEAVGYAKQNNIEFEVLTPKLRIIKPKSYASNFSFNKVA